MIATINKKTLGYFHMLEIQACKNNYYAATDFPIVEDLSRISINLAVCLQDNVVH